MMAAMTNRPETLLQRLTLDPTRAERVTHVEHVPARSGRSAEWPVWVPQLLVDRLALTGVTAPWTHQAQAADLAHGGQSVVLEVRDTGVGIEDATKDLLAALDAGAEALDL